MFYTLIHKVRAQCTYNYTANYGAQAHIDSTRTAELAVDKATPFRWSYLYTYFFGQLRFTILILQETYLMI